ncbi:melanocortin-2 receptor accessory protein-like [Chanodichthys erythropterus]|uniref:melanocortin-2 receptor accessory protein-like n=1 Tax=Chanodichthys erythropterus TaxID=933992 RepID=UPI00351ECAD7
MLQRGCGFIVIPMGGIKGLNPTGVWCSVRSTPSPNRKTMKNSTKSSEYALEYEYYYDYVDPVFVNASALEYNRYSIVLIVWIILAAFIGFFFLILSFISHSGQLPRGPHVKKSGLPLMKGYGSHQKRYKRRSNFKTTLKP